VISAGCEANADEPLDGQWTSGALTGTLDKCDADVVDAERGAVGRHDCEGVRRLQTREDGVRGRYAPCQQITL
jgi:hypothetical protein